MVRYWKTERIKHQDHFRGVFFLILLHFCDDTYIQVYTVLLKIYPELKENKRKPPPQKKKKNHLNIFQEKQPSLKDNFQPKEKSRQYINQHSTDARGQNPYQKRTYTEVNLKCVYRPTPVTTSTAQWIKEQLFKQKKYTAPNKYQRYTILYLQWNSHRKQSLMDAEILFFFFLL